MVVAGLSASTLEPATVRSVAVGVRCDGSEGAGGAAAQPDGPGALGTVPPGEGRVEASTGTSRSGTSAGRDVRQLGSVRVSVAVSTPDLPDPRPAVAEPVRLAAVYS